MNLTIGKNIRALRKQQSITQEALAEHLGVSYQSVSRWENEITYPDMELLPAIAGFFSVSVDALLGIPEAEKEAKAKAAMDDLRREILKKERNIPAIVEKIRDIRRNYLDSEHMWEFWNLGNDGCYRHPEVLPEVRLTAEAFLERVQSPLRYSAIELMSRVEDEEHVEPFLKRYATDSDISKEALALALENAENNDANVQFVNSDLFERIEGKFDVIISNPPYIRSGDIKNLQKEVKDYEPLLALDGKADGLYFYKKISRVADNYLNDNGVIVFEVGYDQANEVKGYLEEKFDVNIVKDMAQIERIVVGRKK